MHALASVLSTHTHTLSIPQHTSALTHRPTHSPEINSRTNILRPTQARFIGRGPVLPSVDPHVLPHVDICGRNLPKSVFSRAHTNPRHTTFTLTKIHTHTTHKRAATYEIITDSSAFPTHDVHEYIRTYTLEYNNMCTQDVRIPTIYSCVPS